MLAVALALSNQVQQVRHGHIGAVHPVVRRKYQRKPDPRSKMVECYVYFYDNIAKFMKSKDYTQSLPERVKSMHDALRGALQVVTRRQQDRR